MICKASATLLLCCGMAAAGYSQQSEQKDIDWPHYSKGLDAQRFVDTDQIATANVTALKPAWVLHTNVMNKKTSFESQPLVKDGIMYVTSPNDHVIALDAATGAIKWVYNPDLPILSKLSICCGQTNRGVALGDGKVFIAQLDATLVALDQQTGRQLWKTTVDDWHQHWTETMAPLYIDGKVIVGASGGEFMNRGHISAYDAHSGQKLWRFYTVPGGTDARKTWAGTSWRFGGGTVWSTPAVDTDHHMLYLTTGNAGPNMNGSQRAGDNLYTASIVAIDYNTGGYLWHFQEVHHDIWDYDSVQPVHLFTLYKDGQQIPALGHASKNGWYYILDRRDGTPLYDVTETRVPTTPAWQHPSPTQPIPSTEELIPHGVYHTPAGYKAAAIYTPPYEETVLIQPGFEGGPTWTPSAYSPRTKYAYICANGYSPWTYRATPTLYDTEGSTAVGAVPGVTAYGILDAMDTTTGKIAWRIQTTNRLVSGVTVAGDLVFFGESQGIFHAADARTGKILWSWQSNDSGFGGANGSPVVYKVKGIEYVAMGFGGNNEAREEGSSSTGDALVAFALPNSSNGNANVVYAHPHQVDTGIIPKSAMFPPVSAPPDGAQVINIDEHDDTFFPSVIHVKAGEQVAIHIRNVDEDKAASINFAVDLQDGPIELSNKIMPGEAYYFVFRAPDDAGSYRFYGPGAQSNYGKEGTMIVGTGADAH